MAVILQDNFTNNQGINLTAHTPQVGTWVSGVQYNGGSTPNFLISSTNDAYLSSGSSSTVSTIVSSSVAGSADVSVRADFVKRTAVSALAVGLVLCFNNTNYSHYLGRILTSGGTSTWEIYRWNGSTPVVLGNGTTGASNAVGTYSLRFSITQAGVLALEYSTDGGTTFSTAVTATDPAPLPAGRVGIHDASGAVSTDTTGTHFDNFVATDSVVPATSYSLAANPPSVVPGGSTTLTATLNGTITSNTTITLNDGGGGGTFSNGGVITLTPAGGMSGSVTYSNPTEKTVTITGTNTTGLTNGSASVTIANLVTLAPGAANYFTSPYNFLTAGGLARTNSPGAYIKARFTGTTSLSIGINVSSLVAASVPAGSYPFLRWTLNNGNWQSQQLTASTTTLQLATGLTVGTTYDLELYFWKVGDINLDRWQTPVNSIGFGSLTINTGGAFSAPVLRPKRAIFFGDSITEGLSILSGAGAAASSATDGYAFFVGAAMNAEYGVRGFGANGWEIQGVGNVPKFITSWNLLWNNQALSLANPPDFIFVVQGTNDALNSTLASTVQADVQSWLSAARTAVGTNCQIFIVVPFGGFMRTPITTGLAAYQTANTSDTKVKLIDLGTEGQKGITAFALGASAFSTDGIHPTSFNHGRLSAMIANQSTIGQISNRSGTTNLSQSVQRYGVNLQNTNFPITGSVFDVAGTLVYYLDSAGNLKSWKKGQASFLNTLPGTNKDEIPAYGSFQLLPGGNITSDNTKFSFGSEI